MIARGSLICRRHRGLVWRGEPSKAGGERTGEPGHVAACWDAEGHALPWSRFGSRVGITCDKAEIFFSQPRSSGDPGEAWSESWARPGGAGWCAGDGSPYCSPWGAIGMEQGGHPRGKEMLVQEMLWLCCALV